MKSKHYFVSTAVLLAFASPAMAQLQAGEAPTPEQIRAGEAPAQPISQEETALRQLQVQMAAVQWTPQSAQSLLDYVHHVDADGLDPSDYAPDRLEAAIAGNDPVAMSTAATDTFLRVSSDLALGHVRDDGRTDWHFTDNDLNGQQQFDLMKQAVSTGDVRHALDGLLPTHPQYGELKQLLATTKDAATRDKVRANMDRWRWLPRDLGARYVIVNVPAYTVALVENGQVVARHKAVVGKPSTATPQLTATATGVIFNPWWEVPESISGELKGKKGYVAVKDGEKVHYRQPPGPANALGRMKVVMPNSWAIYLHDTPSKTLFSKSARAFSHGCIRTQNPLDFAALLLDNPEWDRAAIDRAIAAGKTVKASATTPTPVYIAYFTAAALADNKGLLTYPDIYGRDTKVVTALNDKTGSTALASVAAALSPPKPAKPLPKEAAAPAP